MTTLKRPVDRAVIRGMGNDSYTLIVETAGDKAYIIDLNLPQSVIVKQVSTKTSSGTCTVAVSKQTQAGANTPIAGVDAIAAAATQANTAPTGNGTEAIPAGNRLVVTVSGNAAALDLSVSIDVQRY